MRALFRVLLRQNFRCGRMSCSRAYSADRVQGFAAALVTMPRQGKV